MCTIYKWKTQSLFIDKNHQIQFGLWRYIWRLDDDLDALLYRLIELEELVLIGHLETW